MASLARIEQIPQNETVQPQDGARRFDVSDRPFQFAVIPQVCTLAETAALLRMSERQLEYMLARKQLALAELARIDRKLLDVKAGLLPPPTLKAVERSA